MFFFPDFPLERMRLEEQKQALLLLLDFLYPISHRIPNKIFQLVNSVGKGERGDRKVMGQAGFDSATEKMRWHFVVNSAIVSCSF